MQKVHLHEENLGVRLPEVIPVGVDHWQEVRQLAALWEGHPHGDPQPAVHQHGEGEVEVEVGAAEAGVTEVWYQ